MPSKLGGLRKCNTALLLTLVLIACASPTPKARASLQSPPSPNILLIFTDDMRADQLQHMPKTMAKLANTGVRFEQAYVASPLCGPNRASLFGGQYVHRHNVPCNDQSTFLFDDTQQIGVWAKARGYRTGYFGKWMNGYEPGQIEPFPYVLPGWDDQRIALTGKDRDYTDFDLSENGILRHYGSEYKTVVIASHARQFLAATEPQTPFLAVVAFNAPHMPADPETPADLTAAKLIPLPKPASYNEQDVSDKPAFVQSLTLLSNDQKTQIKTRWHKQLAALASVDRQINLLLKDLEDTGRLDDTLVIFTSDNGFLMGEHRLPRDKSCVYDACARVPLVVKMPGVSPRVDSTHLVSTLDIPATIAAIVNVTPPYPLPGRDLRPLLANPNVAWRDDLLIEFLATDDPTRPPFAALKLLGETYIEYLNGEREYYFNDPLELTNTANDPASAGRRTVLAARLAELRQQ